MVLQNGNAKFLPNLCLDHEYFICLADVKWIPSKDLLKLICSVDLSAKQHIFLHMEK